MSIRQEYAQDASRPECLRRFLAHTDSPWARSRPPTLYGTLGGERVRVVSALRTGRVGVTTDIIGDLSPRRFVAIRELSDLSETLYPMKTLPSVSRPRSLDQVIPWIEATYGVSYAELAAGKKRRDCRAARYAAVGMLLAINRRAEVPSVAAIAQYKTSYVWRLANEFGLRGGDIDPIDRNYLFAIWRRGPLPIGYGAGEIPREVTIRLRPYIAIADGKIDALAIVKMQAQPWLGTSGVDLDPFDEPEADNDNGEDLQCAA